VTRVTVSASCVPVVGPDGGTGIEATASGQIAKEANMEKEYNITEFRFGRNVGARPVGDDRWAEFQGAAVAAAKATAEFLKVSDCWVETHLGTGTWTDANTGETVTEDSAVVTLYWVGELTLIARDCFVADAQWLADRFNQDAVAVVHGTSTLVASWAVRNAQVAQ